MYVESTVISIWHQIRFSMNRQSAQVCPWIYTSRVQRAILEKLTTIYLSNIIGDLQR